MTENMEREDAIEDLVRLIFHLELDPPTMYDAARQNLSEEEASVLAHMLELCPVHGCDAAICADDQVTECEEARA